MIRLTNIFSQEIAKEPMLHDNVAIENIITVISYYVHMYSVHCTAY